MSYRTLASSLLILSSLVACSSGDSEQPETVTANYFFPSSNLVLEEGAGTVDIAVELFTAFEEDLTVVLEASGTATNGEDFEFVDSTIFIPAGSISGSTSIEILDDTLHESNEEFLVQVLTAQGAPLNAGTGTAPPLVSVVLEDNDPAPSVQFAQSELVVAATAGEARLPVVLSAEAGLDVQVRAELVGSSPELSVGPAAQVVALPGGTTEAEVVLSWAPASPLTSDVQLEVRLAQPEVATLGAVESLLLTITSPSTTGLAEVLYSANSVGQAGGPFLYTSGLSAGSETQLGARSAGSLAFELAPARDALAFVGWNENPLDPGVFVIEESSTAASRISGDLLVPLGALKWSPDGAFVAFAARNSAFDELGLFTCRRDGTACYGLLPAGFEFDSSGAPFRWSPDGSRIAFLGSEGSGSSERLFSAAPDGTERILLHTPDDPGEDVSGAFRWSPSGAHLAFSVDTRIYTVRADGSEQFLVTERSVIADANDVEYAFNPSSGELAYRARIDGGNLLRLFSVPPGGGILPLELSSNQLDLQPGWAWSPDGSRIAYFADHGAGVPVELYTTLADGTNNVLVSLGLGSGEDVREIAWSPDSSWIGAWVRGDNGQELYAGEAGGTDWRSLSDSAITGDDVLEGLWSFSPDSNRVAYVAVQSSGAVSFASILASNDRTGTDRRVHENAGDLGTGSFVADALWTNDSSNLVYRFQDGVQGMSVRVARVLGTEPPAELTTTPPGQQLAITQFAVR